MCLNYPIKEKRNKIFAYKVVHKVDSEYYPVFEVAYGRGWPFHGEYPQSFHALLSLKECVDLLREIYFEDIWFVKHRENLVIVAVEIEGDTYKELLGSTMGRRNFTNLKGYKRYKEPKDTEKMSQVAGRTQKILYEIPHQINCREELVTLNF